MTVLRITARQPFAHGRLNAKRGDTFTIEANEARDLEKLGLVSVSPADDGDLDDLVGGKMEPVTTKNKMEAKGDNKMEAKGDNKTGKKYE